MDLYTAIDWKVSQGGKRRGGSIKMDKTTVIILTISAIGFIFLLFKLRFSFDKEPSKWLKLFIKEEKR